VVSSDADVADARSIRGLLMAKTLRLTAVSYGGEPQAGLSKRFGSGQLTIGRGAGNDWVLADTQKHVSNRHCVVEERDGQYSITDLSSNGVFVNGAEQALGHGCSCLLHDGDRIAVGDYQIAVEIETVPSDLPSSVFGEIGSLPMNAVQGSGAEGPFSARIEPMLPPPSPDAAAAAWADAIAPARLEPFPSAAEPLLGFAAPDAGHRGAPDPDRLPAVNSFFRVPDVKPPIIPPDWNALQTDANTTNSSGEAEGAIRPSSEIEAPQLTPLVSTKGSRQDGLGAAATTPHPASTEPAADGLRAFLRGAGLPDVAIGSADAAARLHAYGELLRELTSGVRELVAARALMKSEFRVPHTIIQPSGNNPLKFSVDLEQALQALLAPKSNGYSEPLSAVREAIADLRAHEVGVIAGMRKAAAKLLAALAPATLESRIEATGLLGSLVPAARRARCWEAYEAAYQEVAADLEEDVQGAFREAFATAYAEQVKKL
jgi:type VI secretion system protein